ncbi:S26 family signal peptidase [Hyphomonas adhaerens]|nr:S26 family signal peptidase [Hyphomonas adhaerens]
MGRESNHQRQAKRRFQSAVWSIFSVLGMALIAFPATGIIPTLLLYNPSQSAPTGWYRIAEIDVVSRGDLVAANLPPEVSALAAQRGYLPPGIPVIKTVAALSDDTVCNMHGVLHINGLPVVTLLPTDKAGRPLPTAWMTCRRLQADEYLLLSDRTPDSFDGRYFGAVRRADVIGRAVWINSGDTAGSGGLVKDMEGRSECKINAHGANEGASPCLHIDFYGSILEDIAPSSERILNEDDRTGWFHSGDLACFPPEQPE